MVAVGVVQQVAGALKQPVNLDVFGGPLGGAEGFSFGVGHGSIPCCSVLWCFFFWLAVARVLPFARQSSPRYRWRKSRTISGRTGSLLSSWSGLPKALSMGHKPGSIFSSR